MGRGPVSAEILGLKVTSQPLEFPTAQALVPEVGEFIARAGRELGVAIVAGIKGSDDIARLLPSLDPVAIRSLLETITKHAKTVLATTVVAIADVKGDLTNRNLADDKDRLYVFNERPDVFIPIVIFAGRVTFARFFPAIDLLVGAIPSVSS